jgi:hypothetical protein
MGHMANQANGRIRGLASNRLPVASRILLRGHRGPTSKFGPFLLGATIVLLPLQDHLPSVAGFSIVYIMFGVVGVYVLVRRLDALVKVSRHPVFLAGYLLLSVGLVIESVHSNSDYSELMRYGSMIAGALLVASLCSDERALRAGMYGYLIASVWLSVFLFLTSYGALDAATAGGFEDASRIRAQVFSGSSLRVNLNTMAFISSQGVFVALAFMLTSHSLIRRLLFLGVALFCLIASFVPMSRSGTVIAIVSTVIVLLKYKARRLQAIGAALVLGVGILIWAPDAAFSRLQYSTEAHDGKMEGRARVYTAAWKGLPEYVGIGVGTGNFFKEWANRHGLGDGFGRVYGAHNSFFQVTIYWGLPALLALICIIWQSYRSLPKKIDDASAMALYGIAISLLLWMMATHNLYAKEFSLGLGLIAGAHQWDRRRIASRRHPVKRILGQRTPTDAPQRKTDSVQPRRREEACTRISAPARLADDE